MKKSVKILLIVAAVVVVLTIVTMINLSNMQAKKRALGDESYEITTEVLTIDTGAHTIYGEMFRPANVSGTLPTVIACHGFASTYKNTSNDVGISLAMSGYAVYCFDFYGGSKNSKSGGDMTEMSVFTEQEDLNAVIDYVKALDTADTENLFLLGQSQGGFVAAITAADRRDEIKGLVLYYPALCIAEDAENRYPNEADVPDTYTVMGNKIGRKYSEGLYGYDVYAKISGYTGPVLIIHGDKDSVVDVSYAEKAEAAYENVQLVVLPGESHGFSGKGKDQAAELTYSFLKNIR